MDYVRQLLELLNNDNNNNKNHKKSDDYIDAADLEEHAIHINDVDRVQEFVQDTVDYFNGKLKCVDDLRVGLGRVGDGVQAPMFWWTPLEHPVGFMLDQNGIEPLRSIQVKHHEEFGKMAIYTESDVKLCIDTIADLLKEHRGICLDEEKSGVTKTNGQNQNI